MGRPVCMCTVLDRKFTGTASTASSSWVALSSSALESESYSDSWSPISAELGSPVTRSFLYMFRGRVPAVLTSRELSDGFAMLAGPLAHVILVLLRHSTYGKTLYLWDIAQGYLCLGNRIVRVSKSEVVGRPLYCSFQRLFHVVAKVPGIFQQSTSRVLEVASGIRLKQITLCCLLVRRLLLDYLTILIVLKPG